MDAFATFFDEFRDDGIRLGCFEKLDAGFADGQHGGVDFFDFDCLAHRNIEAQLIAIELERFVDGAHGDSQMVDLAHV